MSEFSTATHFPRLPPAAVSSLLAEMKRRFDSARAPQALADSYPSEVLNLEKLSGVISHFEGEDAVNLKNKAELLAFDPSGNLILASDSLERFQGSSGIERHKAYGEFDSALKSLGSGAPNESLIANFKNEVLDFIVSRFELEPKKGGPVAKFLNGALKDLRLPASAGESLDGESEISIVALRRAFVREGMASKALVSEESSGVVGRATLAMVYSAWLNGTGELPDLKDNSPVSVNPGPSGSVENLEFLIQPIVWAIAIGVDFAVDAGLWLADNYPYWSNDNRDFFQSIEDPGKQMEVLQALAGLKGDEIDGSGGSNTRDAIYRTLKNAGEELWTVEQLRVVMNNPLGRAMVAIELYKVSDQANIDFAHSLVDR